MSGRVPLDTILELERGALGSAMAHSSLGDALINNLRAYTNVRVCYLAATRDGYIIADAPGASAPRRRVDLHVINGMMLQDIHRDYGIPLVVDSFTAVAWGWMTIEEAPLPAGLHTFLTMTKNKLADDRVMENPSDPDAP